MRAFVQVAISLGVLLISFIFWSFVLRRFAKATLLNLVVEIVTSTVFVIVSAVVLINLGLLCLYGA